MNTTEELAVSVPLTLSELIDLTVTVESSLERLRSLGCDFSASTAEGILEKLRSAKVRFYEQLEVNT